MTAQTWTSLQTTLLAATVKSQPPYDVIPPDFAALFPQATSYAEERISTDIPMLGQRTSNTSLTTIPVSRVVDLSLMANPSGGPIIVPESFYLIVNGSRVPFVRADTFLIDIVWPVETQTVAPSTTSFLPRYWAMQDAKTIIYAPTADAPYTIEIAGLFQPTPLSATNPTTYLMSTYPALMEAACMIFLTGAMKQLFGAQSDDPRQALSWEQQYSELVQSARDEEARRRGLRPDVPMPGAPK